MDNRLLCVAKLLENNCVVADIGTDHAKLPIYLIQNNIAKKVIASDVKAAPLKTGQKNVFKAGAADKIELRLSCGFANYKQEEFSVAVIAGMGGETIAEIIKECPFNLNVPLILQPMTCTDRLLDFLNQNGFMVLKHLAVKSEGRIYNILKVIKNGTHNNDPLFNIVGKLDLQDPISYELLHKKLLSLKKMAKEIENIPRKQKEFIKAKQTINLLTERLGE